MATNDQTDPWVVLKLNFVVLSKKLYISEDFLVHLFESGLVDQHDYQTLKSSQLTLQKKTDRLLIDILPKRPAVDFPVFCRILRTVGQYHVAAVLEKGTTAAARTTTSTPAQITSYPRDKGQILGHGLEAMSHTTFVGPSQIYPGSEQTARDGLPAGVDDEIDLPTSKSAVTMSFRKYSLKDVEFGDGDFIDSGGYSKVYLAKTKPDSVRVAVKVFNERSKSRFNKYDLTDLEKEVKILSRLQSHPNVVTLLGYCDDPEKYMLVMEYIEGANLYQLIRDKLHEGISQWKHRLDVALQIGEGLHYIHSQNPPIIHMDLSSHNVLVRYDQESNPDVKFLCKITDFGLSKMKSVSSQSSRYNREGHRTPAGIALFIAPERYTDEFNVSQRAEEAMKADVFSYGMIMFGIHELRWPYQVEGSSLVVAALNNEIRPKFAEESDTERSEYRRLLKSCWSQSPRDRPHMKEVAGRLRDMLQQFMDMAEK